MQNFANIKLKKRGAVLPIFNNVANVFKRSSQDIYMPNTSSYLTPTWSAPANIKAYSTTRRGGFSGATAFASFNLGTYVGDDNAAVAKNRCKLQKDLALPFTPHWLNQQHGTNVNVIEESVLEGNMSGENGELAAVRTSVITINAASPSMQCASLSSLSTVPESTSSPLLLLPPADASCTDIPNQVCAVLTADCLPILLCNRQGTVVSALHAGWRGLAGGIVATTVTALTHMQVDARDLLAWLGPAIGKDAFEVGADVYRAFVDADDGNVDANADTATAFRHVATDKWMANIYLLAKIKLIRCGVLAANIYGGEFCTYHNKELFFSYRRDGGVTGRMATLISINN